METDVEVGCMLSCKAETAVWILSKSDLFFFHRKEWFTFVGLRSSGKFEESGCLSTSTQMSPFHVPWSYWIGLGLHFSNGWIAPSIMKSFHCPCIYYFPCIYQTSDIWHLSCIFFHWYTIIVHHKWRYKLHCSRLHPPPVTRFLLSACIQVRWSDSTQNPISQLAFSLLLLATASWTPQEADSAMENCMWEVYWRFLSEWTLRWGKKEAELKRGWTVMCSLQMLWPIPWGTLKLRWPFRVVLNWGNGGRPLYLHNDQLMNASCSQKRSKTWETWL